MNDDKIKAIFLANGFKEKRQGDGDDDLDPHVYEAARALLDSMDSIGAVPLGLYAIRHIDNWCGERDVMTSLATYDHDGQWRHDENGALVLSHDGDRILKAWPLDHVGGQALTYDAGVAAAAKTIRAAMDEFREEHSEPDPAPGTSGMSQEHLDMWHIMYRLERAVRMLKDSNPEPQPAAEAPPMQNMATAPRDGTRILIYGVTSGYCQKARGYVPNGEKWQESWFVDGKFQEWTGNAKGRVAGGADIEPLGWAPVPVVSNPGPALQPIAVPGQMRHEDVLLVGGPLDGSVRTVFAGLPEYRERPPRQDLGDYNSDTIKLTPGENLVYHRKAIHADRFKSVVYLFNGADLDAVERWIPRLKSLQAQAWLNAQEDANG